MPVYGAGYHLKNLSEYEQSHSYLYKSLREKKLKKSELKVDETKNLSCAEIEKIAAKVH
jgi:hypothetical protein